VEVSQNHFDSGYDENYHTVTSVVAPSVNYEAPASLTSILQRDAHLTFGLMFKPSIRLDRACVEQVPLD
jgi:hypothetical protein